MSRHVSGFCVCDSVSLLPHLITISTNCYGYVWRCLLVRRLQESGRIIMPPPKISISKMPRFPQNQKLMLGGKEVALAQQYAAIAIISIPLFLFAGAGKSTQHIKRLSLKRSLYQYRLFRRSCVLGDWCLDLSYRPSRHILQLWRSWNQWSGTTDWTNCRRGLKTYLTALQPTWCTW